jgi:hypothetical protein
MTDPKIDPLIQGALNRLAEIGPKWIEEQQRRWNELFIAIVAMLYPGKPLRKPRAKKAMS